VIDSHCHLDKPEFDADREAVLERARAAGVSDVVVPAIGPDGWAPLAAWASRTPGVHFGLGIHPQLLPELDPAGDERMLAELDAALARGGAAGIGECGVDAKSAEPGAGPWPAPMDRQVEVLRGHLALARRHRLPVMLHCLRAHDPLLALLREEPLPAGGVLHSYSGSAEQVGAYAALGLSFSFAGSITYERARKPVAAARAVARDRLLVETDAPDQTPRPHRGRNEPAFLQDTAAALAAALGLAPAEVDALTSQNARRLFGI
jgi:TatD DNase family protein